MSEENKSDTITIKKDSLWKYSTFILAALVVVGAFVFFSDNGSVTGNVANNGALPAPPQTEVTLGNDVKDDAILGDENAEVTIYEFTDFQCPYCGRHHTQTFPEIKSQYVDTGKVKYVIADFPLTSIHPMAQPAAESAECVREQGGDESYFEYVDKLFTNQQTLSNENFNIWSKEMGYDISACLSSGKYTAEVQKDAQVAQAAGGRGTPFFVVVGKNGKGTVVSGAQPFSAFQQVIEQKLA